MKTVGLGQTGVEVSTFCLGAMYFGTRNDEASSFRLLDQYVEAGGSFIDTANIYAHWVPGGQGGESEALLGRWMKARGNRSGLTIATKVGFELPGVPRGLTASLITAECETSLRRLSIETLDLYYAHVDDRHTPQDETLEAFDRLVKVGKVRLIGASNFAAWRLERARWISQTHGWTGYCCVQQRFTYVRPKPGASFDPQMAANDDLLDYCRDQHLTLLPYSPLLGGAYTRADRPMPPEYAGPDTEARRAALSAVAQELGATPNQVVLAWMSQHGWVPLMAASTEAQMSENLGVLDLCLTPAQMEQLDSTGA